MASVHTYLNFEGTTEEAFEFYRTVFGGEFLILMRMGEMPDVPEDQRNLIMHVGLRTLGDHVLMGTDATERVPGNMISIMLQPDTKPDADRLFAALAEGGNINEPLADQFWGDYYGSLTDRFGIKWMVNVDGSAQE